jgi:N-acetylglucosaminyldiphosphoundecaprenol N-acetyl-beta-D-mannosaminyltransferase
MRLDATANRDTTGGATAVELLGVRLDNVAHAEVVSRIVSGAAAGHGGWVVTPNVDILRQLVADPELAHLVGQADIAIPDGMPLVWASRLQGTPLQTRVSGSELIYPLCDAAARHGLSVFLLGGAPGVAELAAERFRERSSSLRIAGVYAPPTGFEHDERERKAILQVLRKAEPDIVVCCLGFPKQERTMAALSMAFPSTWFIGAGGTFTIASGLTPAAPRWMRRSGLEWAHRLRLEPRRLFYRYVVADLPFASRMFLAVARSRLRSQRRQSVEARTTDGRTQPGVEAIAG